MTRRKWPKFHYRREVVTLPQTGNGVTIRFSLSLVSFLCSIDGFRLSFIVCDLLTIYLNEKG
jgi:hypothetical protein